MDTSNFVPYVCDQAIMGEYKGLESTVPSSAISGGSVAAEWSYPIQRTLAPVVPIWVRLTLGPNTCFTSFYSIIVPIPSFLCPLYCPKFHLSSPKREVCEVLSFREPKRLWLYCPKHGPNKAQTDISLANERITWLPVTKSVVPNTFAFINIYLYI